MPRWLGFGLLIGMAACSEDPVQPEQATRDFFPSFMSAPVLDLERFAKTDDCADCHADVASHWMHSAHAYASFDNPWYRASVDSFRDDRGKAESRFCAGCHDPLLLMSGAIDEEVEPDDDLSYAGITCLVCHSIESTRSDGNASFTLTDAPVLIPDPANPAQIEAHRARLSLPPLRTAALCGSCHRSFSGPAMGNPNQLPGIDDLGEWASSTFGGGVPEHLVPAGIRTCQSCHMPSEAASGAEMAGASDGRVSTHRWAASHTAMAAQLPDPEQARHAAEQLEGAVIVDLGNLHAGGLRYPLPERARLHGGRPLTFDVVVQSERVGHRFPGGVRDLHDAWIEVEVRDARGELIAASRPTATNEEDVYVFRATMLDESASPELLHRVHRFSAPAFDRTLRPQDAQAVRYSMTLPRKLALPLRIEARLMHRKHSLRFQTFACQASQTNRGAGFAEGATRRDKVALDPCLPQPLTEVARAVTWIGRGASARKPIGGAARPKIERLLSQALALLHATQEHAASAAPALDRALALAKRAGSPQWQAKALVLSAQLASRQGRPTEAVALARRAEALIGPSPVLDRVRAEAYARVWKWARAAQAYERVTRASPFDWRAWRDLAQAYGSLSDDRKALAAAEAGLRLAPHDEGLLRSRALALRGLGRPEAELAEAQWLSHRAPDDQPALLFHCEQAHDRCRTDRQPIPHYTLTPAKAFHARLDPQ
ncbi:MAG: multiheme c-type cytochrome [Myxococcales bacterium]|jgi:tetratricopeptide (TPR) repeat protein